MLFLYRPRQTWMPFAMPREPTEQDVYRRDQQESFEATRRVAPPRPSADPAAQSQDPVANLEKVAQLHASGDLTDEEFAIAKAKLLHLDQDS